MNRRLRLRLLPSILCGAFCLASVGAGTATAQEGPTAEVHLDRRPESPVAVGDADDAHEGPYEPFEWMVIPIAAATSDIGVGGALIGLFYWHEPGVEPYRDALLVLGSLTNELVQFHAIGWERIGIFDLPLRLRLGLVFEASPVDNFCGIGNEVQCDEAEARAVARGRGLEPGQEAYEEFVENYYQVRTMRPSGKVRLQWDGVGEPEMSWVWTWEGTYTISGFFGDDGPFPGSLYAQRFADGEEGFLSELRTGLQYDLRDNERRPTAGSFLAGFLRHSSAPIGSRWDYVGMTLTASGYTTLDPDDRLILAMRGVVDLLWGDPPVLVLGSVGGPADEAAFGGNPFGRGIRARRYIGRIKGIGQTELRWRIFGEPEEFQMLAEAFVDAGWVGAGWSDFGGDPARILVGFGGGLGVAWGTNFVIRVDVGLSPHEDYTPQFYLSIEQPY